MILEALATALNTTTLDTYPLIGDVESELPFGVFSNEPIPFKTKEGIEGYANSVVVTVLCNDIDDIIDFNVAIQAAITNMSGTMNGTIIEASEYIGGAVVYDEKLKCYRCDNEFLIDTKNN